jgi:hypothetical protein
MKRSPGRPPHEAHNAAEGGPSRYARLKRDRHRPAGQRPGPGASNSVGSRPACLGQKGQAGARDACRWAVISAHRPQRRLEQEHGDGHCQAELLLFARALVGVKPLIAAMAICDKAEIAQLDLGASARASDARSLRHDRNRKDTLETRVCWRIRSIKFGPYCLRSVITRPRPLSDLAVNVSLACSYQVQSILSSGFLPIPHLATAAEACCTGSAGG